MVGHNKCLQGSLALLEQSGTALLPQSHYEGIGECVA